VLETDSSLGDPSEPKTPLGDEDDTPTMPMPVPLPLEKPQEPKEAPPKIGDVEVRCLGDTAGWWVEGKSPRGQKRWGPFSMMEALSTANQLRSVLRLKGRLKGS
jgi:hypothetical protein